MLGEEIVNHSTKGTTLEISARTFVCYLCFIIIDHETKENQSINQSINLNMPEIITKGSVDTVHNNIHKNKLIIVTLN